MSCTHSVTYRAEVELDLDDDGAALATARAHRRDADAPTTPLQLVNERRHHPSTGCSDGMTEAATTSGEVDQLFVQPVFAACRDRDRRESD